MVLRFKWQDPSGAYKVAGYVYEKINFRVDDGYGSSPQIKLIFTKETLGEELDLRQDLSVYNFNDFLKVTAAIDIYLNQETYDSEMTKLQLP